MGRRISMCVMASTVAALGGCLEAPAPGRPPFAPDAGPGPQPIEPGDDAGSAGVSQQGCRLSVTYAAELLVDDPAMVLHGVAVIGNAGDQPIELGDLWVLTVSQGFDYSVEVDVAPEPVMLQPGEAHGELDDEVRAMVEPSVQESWTDDGAPTIVLRFDRDDGFTAATAQVTIGIGDASVPLTLRFYAGDSSGDDQVVAPARTIVPCS